MEPPHPASSSISIFPMHTKAISITPISWACPDLYCFYGVFAERHSAGRGLPHWTDRCCCAGADASPEGHSLYPSLPGVKPDKALSIIKLCGNFRSVWFIYTQAIYIDILCLNIYERRVCYFRRVWILLSLSFVNPSTANMISVSMPIDFAVLFLIFISFASSLISLFYVLLVYQLLSPVCFHIITSNCDLGVSFSHLINCGGFHLSSLSSDFSNTTRKPWLQRLAEADEHEVCLCE